MLLFMGWKLGTEKISKLADILLVYICNKIVMSKISPTFCLTNQYFLSSDRTLLDL